MSKRDYYEVLGVDSSASEQEVKNSWRRKVAHLCECIQLLGSVMGGPVSQNPLGEDH